jgi:Tol biopolymer transport system component
VDAAMNRAMRLGVLGLVCAFMLLAYVVATTANVAHIPMLTYLTHYHDIRSPTNDTVVLHLLDRLTGRNQSLLESRENIFDQTWSSDGQWLAISVDGDRGSTSIRVLNMYGDEVAALHANLGDAVDPNWLPNNSDIIFAFYDGFNTTIYRANIHTPTEWQVVLELPEFFTSNMKLSPDGQRMLIAGGRDNIALYLIEMDNPQLRVLTDYSTDFSWSPDGTRIAFSRNDETTRNGDLFTVNLQHHIQRRLTDNISREFQPTWSPDGSRIAFVSDRDGDTEIYVMNADGTNVRQVTFNNVNDSHPAWIP